MSTNEFARILLTWIKSFLSWIGIPRDRLNELDEIIFLILIVVIAFAVGAVFHYLSVRFTRKVLKYKNISFLSSLIEHKRQQSGYNKRRNDRRHFPQGIVFYQRT